jgi:hypothetical protein
VKGAWSGRSPCGRPLSRVPPDCSHSRQFDDVGELVANAFDAGASLVDVMVHENDLGGIDSIVVWDIGRLHLSRLDWRVSRPSGQPTRGADGLCDSQV